MGKGDELCSLLFALCFGCDRHISATHMKIDSLKTKLDKKKESDLFTVSFILSEQLALNIE